MTNPIILLSSQVLNLRFNELNLQAANCYNSFRSAVFVLIVVLIPIQPSKIHYPFLFKIVCNGKWEDKSGWRTGRRTRLHIWLNYTMWIHNGCIGVLLGQPKTFIVFLKRSRPKMQYPNKTFCIIQCHLFELFLCALYVWHLVCLGLFYHVSHAPPWRISSQYESLTSTAWKPSCSLCQQRPDVSWTPLCIFSMDVIDCKGRWQALWSKWNYFTSPVMGQCKNGLSMHRCLKMVAQHLEEPPTRTTAI